MTEKSDSLLYNSDSIKSSFSVLNQLLEESKLGFVLLNEDYKAIETNNQFAKMLGYSKEEILQLHSWDWDNTLTKEEIINKYNLEPIPMNVIETIHRRKDGKLINVSFTSDVALINGKSYAFCLCSDNTEQSLMENALKKNEARLKNFVENAHDLMFTINNEYMITYFSPNVKNLYNLEPTYFEGKNYFCFLQEEDSLHVKNAFEQLLSGYKKHIVSEYRIYDPERNLHWFSGSFTLSKDEYGQPMILGIARDIAEQKKYEEKLTFLSFHDTLTGLYNRAYFQDEIIRLENSTSYPITIFSIDIDGLKFINDTYGHYTGDQMIKNCAGILIDTFRKEDTISRIGGDEFIVILPNTDESAAKIISERLNSNIESQTLHHETQSLNLSFGFSTGTDTSIPLIDIYRQADNKLLRVKDSKRKKFT